MRILLVDGALGRATQWLGAGLLERGDSVVALCSSAGRTVRYELGALPVVAAASDTAARTSGDLIEVLRPDAVHTFDPGELGVAPLLAARHRGVPVVASDPSLAERVLAVCDQVGDIPIGVPDLGWRRAPHLGPLRIGYRGGRELVEVLDLLPRSDYELRVLDPSAATGRRRLRELDFPVPGLVRIVADPRDYLSEIDVLVALWPQPLEVRLALAHGVWPVAIDIPVHRIIDSGGNGDLVRSAAAAAQALDRVLTRFPEPTPHRIPSVGEYTESVRSWYRSVTLATRA